MDNTPSLLSPSPQTCQISVVNFRLDRQIFALPIEPIQQIIEMVTVTPVPLVKESVEGIINFHGTIVPVVNLRCYLALPKTPPCLHTSIILVSIAEKLIGLMVDQVLEVSHWLPNQIACPDEILPGEMGGNRLLRGVIQTKSGAVILLDPHHLFSPLEAHFLGMTLEGITRSIPADQLAPEITVPLSENDGDLIVTQTATTNEQI